jgi:trimeric autotransporter adhesin
MKAKTWAGTLCLAAGMISAPAMAGPLVLMGIDAEDGGVGGHGPLSAYTDVASSILGATTNGGGGILVFGGGAAGSNVRSFWTALAASVGQSVTFATGAASVSAQSLAGFQMIGVASDNANTPSGGLTAAENVALAARQAEIAGFVNGGGGLLGFSQADLGASAYAYLGGLGAFSFGNADYQDVTATAAGNAVGITNTNLDICCWHDTFTAFPSFLNVLATVGNTNTAAAIGGVSVRITPIPEPSTMLLVAAAALAFRAQRRKA